MARSRASGVDAGTAGVAAPSSSAAPASGLPVLADSESAREQLAALRKSFLVSAPVLAAHDLTKAPDPMALQPIAKTDRRPVISEGVAGHFEMDGRLARPVFDGKALTGLQSGARIGIPKTAGEPIELTDQGSGMTVRIWAKHVDAAAAFSASNGLGLYRAAAPGGGNVVIRPTPTGAEDFVELRERGQAALEYLVDVSEVAGLRFVDNTLEFLDKDGSPRWRVAHPYVIGTDGASHEATLSVQGCHYDTSPVGPWDRDVTAPGSSTCSVRVTWDDAAVSYPAIVDPAWTTPADTMVVKRQNHCQVLLSNGKILLVAGQNDLGVPTRTAEIWDPTAKTWAATGVPVALKRQLHVCVPLKNGKALVADGNDGGSTPVLAAETYDPTAGTFSAAGTLAADHGTTPYLFMVPVGTVGAETAGGAIIFGNTQNGELYHIGGATPNTWTNSSNMNSARYYMSGAGLTNGNVLIAGGYVGTSVSQTAEIYNPTTNVFTPVVNSMNVPREYLGVIGMPNGKALIAGGYTGSSYTASAEVYDPTTGSFTLTNNTLGSTANNPLMANYSATGKPARTVVFQYNTAAYDPAGNVFAPAGYAHNGASYYASALSSMADGRVMVTGGNNGTAVNQYSIFDLIDQGKVCDYQQDGECTTGHCSTDGYCCDKACNGPCDSCSAAGKGTGSDGTCGFLKAGAYGNCSYTSSTTCGLNGQCDGAGKCTYWPTGTVCSYGSCITTTSMDQNDLCDGAGNCVVNGTVTCAAGYLCLGGTASGAQCNTYCWSDSDCQAAYWCDFTKPQTTGYTCVSDLANGTACTYDGQCTSGHCSPDGVCCDGACKDPVTGLRTKCMACLKTKTGQNDGLCKPVTAGTDPDNGCDLQSVGTCGQNGWCDGTGACQLYASGTVCVGQNCAGTTQNNASKCDGAGTCVNGGVTNCATGYSCTGTSCNASCTSDTQCAPAYYCKSNVCVPDDGNGVACTANNHCQSNNCVEGVCCDQTCADTSGNPLPCKSCLAARKGSGADGTCGNIAAGTDPKSLCAPDSGYPASCKGDGFCDGSGSCRVYALTGTSCQANSCPNTGNVLTQFACNGAGQCLSSQVSCNQYACASTGTSCGTTCSTDANCATGYYCSGSTCVAKKANAGACTAGNQCTTGFCVDGVCCDSACTATCKACSAAAKGSGNDGVCDNVKAGADPHNNCTDARITTALSCDFDGQCNGTGACRRYAYGTSCGASTCTGNVVTGAICDGQGSCISNGTTDCTPSKCTGGACKTACTSDNDCVTGYFCDITPPNTTGTCTAKKAQGGQCNAGTQCTSTYCVDGVCCDSACTGTCKACSAAAKGYGSDGSCDNVQVGSDPKNSCPDDGPTSCRRDGFCDGLGACENYSSTTVCGSPVCVGNLATPQMCNGLPGPSGACVANSAVAADCGKFVCNAGACPTSCASDTDCTSGNICVGDVCTVPAVLGSPCTENRDCGTGHCVDSVCCDSACNSTCKACSALAKGYGQDGVCDNATAGTDPHNECPDSRVEGTNPNPNSCLTDGSCNGSGACRQYADGTSCGASNCAGNSVVGQICTQGACITSTSGIPCAPYLCSVDHCTNPCTADNDCASGNYCDTGTCKEKLANGNACTASNVCNSGFCVDGFCCDSSCTGECEACDSAGGEGVCSPVTGNPHGTRKQCSGTDATCKGTCDGVNAAICTYAGSDTVCGSPECANGKANKCDSKGGCTKAAQNCSPYTCAATGGCNTSCTTNADCATGYGCDSKSSQCTPRAASATCSTDKTQSIGANSTESCAPYLCNPATGLCLVACSDTTQCATGAVCDSASKTCIGLNADGGPSSSSNTGGCACSTVGSTEQGSSGAGLFGLALLGLVVTRRRGSVRRSAA